MSYFRSTSSRKNAANMPRVQATASRLALVTSGSCFADLSRMMLDVASYSSNTSINVLKYIRRFLGGKVAKCARMCAPIKVSATFGGGMSTGSDGGNGARSGITPLGTATRPVNWRHAPLRWVFSLGRLINVVGDSLASRGMDLMTWALARLLRLKSEKGE